MCLYPKLIQNRRYIPNKKNGGQVPVPKDNRVLAVPVGCGRCMECRKQEARKWQIRMLEDIRGNKNGVMVTLTFSNESIGELVTAIREKKGEEIKGYELDNEIATIAVHRFRERWRKEHKKSIRHWLITELGHKGTENIHLHGIVWTDKGVEQIKKHWQYGHVWCGTYVSEATVNYTIKYVHKTDVDHKEYKPKVLTSAGIGSGYMKRSDADKNKFKGGETREYYKTRTGHKMALPVYYRNKIYSDEEREKLWLDKLNKETRFVNGVEVDISQGEEKYYAALKTAREKNKRLGYQDDKIDWNQKKYEEDRRNMLTQKRMEQAEEIKEYKGEQE